MLGLKSVGEEAEEIRVLSVRMSDKDLYKQGIYTKVGITYHMHRKRETAESYIDLPISQARYMELLEGLTPNSTVWNSVNDALKQLTYLQGYEQLGSWSIELKVETDGEDADGE